MTLTTRQVADFFLTIRDDEDELTHLKLQKLCYYAQATHLAVLGRRLFDEQLLAWENGPVVRSIWDRFAYRHGVLPRPEFLEADAPSPEVTAFLDRVYRKYGQYSAWMLRQMTHKEEPWIEGWGDNGIIRDETMRRYFRAKLDSAAPNGKLSADEVRVLISRPEAQEAIRLSRADFAKGAYREA